MPPLLARSRRLPALAGVLLLASAASAQTYSVRALDPIAYERWPVPATFAVRRTATANAETVAIALSGTATLGTDYNASATTSVAFPAGSREVWVTITPLADSLAEANETITLTLPGKGASGSMFLENRTSAPTETEATRFLLQSAFGADPETLAEVRRRGFSNWIDDQIARPKGYLQPRILAMRARGESVFHPATKVAMWEEVMRKLPASGPASGYPDPLRQRVAYSLLQIFVISQNIDALSLNSEGVTHYYDRLLDGAFGNFRTLLKDVCMHPCMGRYLSHVGNQKADLALNRFPDENFAREVMQLFSIGLWELNPDGTQKKLNGKPIPTYDQNTIRNYARVFTGINYGGPGNDYFQWSGENFKTPMRLYDQFHDLAPKTLLSGVTTPARTWNGAEGPNDPGTAAMADVDAAVDSLFNHPNVGPFIGRLLIQRLVTSNPSPGYIGRVSAVFGNNGRGVRGDMGAVVKAILMDTEARSIQRTITSNVWGKKREPYLTLFQLGKTFEAQPQTGNYNGATYLYDFMRQEPFQSPSVFNFYLPTYRPSGAMTTQNLRGPEFQIMTAVTANGTLNLQYKMIYEDLSLWSPAEPDQIKIRIAGYLPLADDPDALVQRIAQRLLDRPLRPRTFQILREAVAKIPLTDQDARISRVRMAIYLLVSSPEFQIQK